MPNKPIVISDEKLERNHTMGFLEKFTWKEYFLVGGLLIIWSLVAYAGLTALTGSEPVTFGFVLLIGVIATGALFILIAIIDRVF